jgi:hypothetical protein
MAARSIIEMAWRASKAWLKMAAMASRRRGMEWLANNGGLSNGNVSNQSQMAKIS